MGLLVFLWCCTWQVEVIVGVDCVLSNFPAVNFKLNWKQAPPPQQPQMAPTVSLKRKAVAEHVQAPAAKLSKPSKEATTTATQAEKQALVLKYMDLRDIVSAREVGLTKFDLSLLKQPLMVFARRVIRVGGARFATLLERIGFTFGKNFTSAELNQLFRYAIICGQYGIANSMLFRKQVSKESLLPLCEWICAPVPLFSVTHLSSEAEVLQHFKWNKEMIEGRRIMYDALFCIGVPVDVFCTEDAFACGFRSIRLC